MRIASIVLAVVATVLPAGWAYLSTIYFCARAHGNDLYVCSLPTFAAAFVVALTGTLISAAAVTYSVLAYLALPRPRPLKRRLEVCAVSLPLMLGVVAITYLWLAAVAGIGFLIA